MSTFNRVILIGNLGQDPTTKRFDNGGQVTNFSIATTEHWKDKQTGEKKSITEWSNIVVNGKLSELADQYLMKGSKVLIEGKLRTRKWTDANNIDRHTTEVVANQMTSMGSPKPDDNPPSLTMNQGKPENAGNEFLNMGNQDDDDGLPF